MNTINEYRRLKYGRASRAMKLIWAGHEPDEFISMFPYWKVNEHVKTINEKVFENFPYTLKICINEKSIKIYKSIYKTHFSSYSTSVTPTWKSY